MSLSQRQPFTKPGLRAVGFHGFEAIRHLRDTGLADVLLGAGVYAILRASDDPPNFLKRSHGGWFKHADPSVPTETLFARWVPEAVVLYIGKADLGKNGKRGLRTRMGELLDFGAGKPIGHRGGRYLWQVQHSDDFIACWRADATPRATEKALIEGFRLAYGARPYANIAG